jgi:predicted RNase H-like nuclease (RuvC/YqgF family)
MEDPIFRKRLLLSEINRLKVDLKKNQEFINLFQRQNNSLLKQIEEHFTEIELLEATLQNAIV